MTLSSHLPMWRLLAWGLATAGWVLVSACSSGPQRPEPAPLEAVQATQPATGVWRLALGPMDPLILPVTQGQQVVLANAAGVVHALNAGSGVVLWQVSVGGTLSAGVGADAERAAVVTSENELVALNAQGVQWRVGLPARVFTAPLVAGGRVFVLAADRSVWAFDGQTGRQLWQQSARGTEPLVLQQPGLLMAVGNTLVAGISGRMVGMDPLNGRVRWDVPLARARGINEIERLVDVVAGVGRVGDEVCVRAFQSAVGCVDAASGRLQWSQVADGATGLDADAERVYGTESNGRVRAWQRASGEAAWSVDRLLHRGLTAPLAAGRSIVIGDAQGDVHLLSGKDGSLLNRLSTDGSAIVGTPLLLGETLVAVTRNGGVFAWRPE